MNNEYENNGIDNDAVDNNDYLNNIIKTENEENAKIGSEQIAQDFNPSSENQQYNSVQNNAQTQSFEPVNNGANANYSADNNGYNQYQYNYNAVNNANIKKNNVGIKVFCVLAAVAVLISLVASIGFMAGKFNDLTNDNSSNNFFDFDDDNSNSVIIQQGTVPNVDGITPDKNGKYTSDQVAKLVMDSVVNIDVYSKDSNSTSIASGVIMNTDGYIISNDHIYSSIPNAQFIITLANGKTYDAVFVAGDKRSDLCVLKMTNPPKDLTAATFADSDKLLSGEEVIAIGSPHGYSSSVTKGVVSSPNRRITYSNTSGGTTTAFSMKVIQTDTAINSGSSGGALVNMYGQIVGINSSKIVISGYEGLCFAIPANDVVDTAKDLIQYKKVQNRARLGITYSEINAAASRKTGLPIGILISSVDVSSNLSSQGVAKNDVITEVNGKAVTSQDILLDVIDDSKAGDEITLKIFNSTTNNSKTVKAKLLLDESVSSYSTEAIQTTTSIFPNIF